MASVSNPRKNRKLKNRPGPLTKKPKCRKLVTPFASCSATGDLILSNSSRSDTSSSRPKREATTRSLTTKKKKLKATKKSVDITGSSDSEWEYVDEFCSRTKNKDRSEFPYKYRCTLCLNDNKPLPVHLCNTYGDLKRHLQSQRHMEKSFKCENPGCSRIFTRDDSLKRHVKKCNLGFSQ